jgi:hypothetical protein
METARMRRLFATLTAATFLAGGAAFAQMSDDELMNMNESFASIQASVSTELARLGMDVDTDAITLGEMAEIQLVFSDASLNDQERAERIEAILN